MSAPTPMFSGEVQFRRYSDTSTQGQQIVLALADREALSAFIGKEGKRFMAVLVEIGDDEQPVEPPQERFKPGPMCREAIDLCAMPDFWAWCEGGGWACRNEAEAKAIVLRICRIGSRKDLDTMPAAAYLFRNDLRVPFMKWQRKRQQMTPASMATDWRAA